MRMALLPASLSPQQGDYGRGLEERDVAFTGSMGHYCLRSSPLRSLS